MNHELSPAVDSYVRTVLRLNPDPVFLHRLGQLMAPGGVWVVL